jgi:ribonuclease BN (tRNA processing enzyme)
MGSRLKILPLGTNGAFTETGFNTNYLVSLQAAERSKMEFLFDCGTTAGVAFRAINRNLLEAEDVYLSHLHLDHVGGLVQLGLRRYSAGLQKPRLYACKDLAQKLWPQFLQTFMEIALSQSGDIERLGLEDFFTLIEIPEQTKRLETSVEIAGINCTPIKFAHPNGSDTYGLVIQERVLITSDTIFLPSALESVANRFPIEAIFHHCTFNPGMVKLHAMVEELKTLPEDLRELIILNHYDDTIPENGAGEFELAEAGKIYEFKL